MKRALALIAAASLLVAMPAVAETSVVGSVQALDIDTAGGSASPLSLAVDVRHDLSRSVYVGGQLVFALDDDTVGAGPGKAEVSNAFGVDVGLQHAFNHNFAVYGFAGLGMAKVGATTGDGDGLSLRYGAGARINVARNGVLDIGWSSLFDDDMDFAGTDVAVEIAGPHVGLGYRF